MHSTRRLLNRHLAVGRYRSTAALLVAALVAGGAVASCTSKDDDPPFETGDAAAESSTTPDGALSDAGAGDARRDVEAFDGGPSPVVCGSSPCATSLATTWGVDEFDRSEGFCALLQDGTVACWGANGAGQLGRGEDGGFADSVNAARVTGLSEITQLDHTCALDKSGGVWCWGTAPYSRNDAAAQSTERAPVKLDLPAAKGVAIGIDVGCAVVDDRLLCWGKNTSALVAPHESAGPTAILPPRAVDLPGGGAPIRQLAVGKAAFVLREDGAAMSWGANPPLARVSSLAPDPTPAPISITGITSLDVTSDTGCAAAAGTGYCWGRAMAYPVFIRIVPEPVVAPEPLVQIATTRSWSRNDLGDIIMQPQRWCAVGGSGAVYCWGFNTSGQAGDGTKAHAFEAVKVQGLPERASVVKTLPDATCALLTNGKVYCWGANYYGQLGNGKPRVPSLVPEEVVLP